MEPPDTRRGIVSWIGDASREKKDARRGNRLAIHGNRGGRSLGKLWANPARTCTEIIQQDQPIHLRLPADHLGAQPRVNARPGILVHIGAGILAQRPNNELIGIGWAVEDIGVVAIQAAFGLDDGNPPTCIITS